MTNDEVKKIDEAIENEDWKQVWELSDYVESYKRGREYTDVWGLYRHGTPFEIDVRCYETPKYGKCYIARIYDESDEDCYNDDTGEFEPVYVDDYDYENVLDYLKDGINRFVTDHVLGQVEDLKKDWKFIGTQEQVDAIIDEEIETEIKNYVNSYSLDFYYGTENREEEDRSLASCLEGSDVDDKIEALFDKTKSIWDDDEEEEN